MAYSTLSEEDALIASLGVPVEVYATTPQGRPCRAVRFGSGPALLLVTGAQHGNELPGREGALQFIEQLAADPSPVPAGWSVLVAPTCNPDGVNIVNRMNANGVDLNRDHVQLTQAESRGIGRILGRERPLVVIDLHLGGVAEDVQLQTGEDYPGVLPAVTASTNTFLAAVTAHLNGQGFTVGTLPNLRLETLLHIRAQLDNTVSIVAEIDTTPAIDDEVRLALELCRGALAAASASTATLVSDRAAADATPITALNVRLATVDPAPAGYQLLDVGAAHVDAFRLDGATPLRTPLDGYVLDPAAEYSIPATRLATLPPPVMRYSHTVEFAHSGLFRPADYAGIVAVDVEVKGGSGGGGGAAATGAGQHSGGGGGGGGEYRRGWLAVDSLEAEVTVTIGAGGAGGVTDGGNGGQSAFGTHVTAKGGIGGFHLPATTALGMIAGGEGGYGGTGGSQSIPGGAGAQYIGTPTAACGGIGGSSHLGGGGRSSTTTNHQPGRGFGGGGGGAANTQNQAAQSGGAGAPGVVRVSVYVAE